MRLNVSLNRQVVLVASYLRVVHFPQLTNVMSHENNSFFALKSILKKYKLNNTNFLEWHRNLKIVLKFAKKHYVLEDPVPNEPEGNTAAAHKACDKHNADAIEVACLMQATMSSDLQKNMEDMSAFDMI
ncbi:hypothetical protein E3N88_04393 [Mikania micrantha]|uniref:Retrotransposon Copia-like N-terminal domain-containing protein n=1 Tax=Mikania micrantha TaxID=192012 RepID=A0A5N6PUB6_9ASTR|nr:hypothetical protein E3N88_04393 [Mikania micrantha]